MFCFGTLRLLFNTGQDETPLDSLADHLNGQSWEPAGSTTSWLTGADTGFHFS
jgi:hypothetical protein